METKDYMISVSNGSGFHQTIITGAHCPTCAIRNALEDDAFAMQFSSASMIAVHRVPPEGEEPEGYRSKANDETEHHAE